LTLHTDIAEILPLAMVDADRLQQTLWNLLSNAVKFTPPGGRVDVSLRHADGQFEIVVSDTGIGIRADFLPRVFERFRQADSRYAREHGGLGLGLAIARHLTEMHGGTLTAQSEGPGLGATFTMRLPAPLLTAAEIARDETVRHDVADASPVTGRLDDVRVVAVDDDPDEALMIREALEAVGARVRVAHSGADALVLLQEEPADVLLADVGMPEMDGFELIRHVRDLAGANAAVAAAAITAYTKSQDHERALASGFNMHLAKPVDPAELISTVRRLFPR
jgi:CheY-like chemotaxis protein/anti-sigma regulatory factor (Ser/Thr protein kinase)